MYSILKISKILCRKGQVLFSKATIGAELHGAWSWVRPPRHRAGSGPQDPGAVSGPRDLGTGSGLQELGAGSCPLDLVNFHN